MYNLKILVVSGSTRSGSFNRLLANAARQAAEDKGAVVTLADLSAHPMPLVDAEIAGGTMPAEVESLHALFAAHDGIFLATPEYNAFPSPLLLNTLDWLSRVRHYEGGTEAAFGAPLFAIGAASPSPIGGLRALMALRQKLELGLGATVIPAMVHVAAAYQAFDDAGQLRSESDLAMLDRTITQLIGRLRR